MLYLNIDDHKITALVAGKTETSAPILLERSVMTDHYDQVLEEIAQVCRDNYEAPIKVKVFVCGPVTIAPTEEMITTPEVLFNHCFDFTDKMQRKVCYDEIIDLHALLIFGVKISVVESLSRLFPDDEIRFHSALTPMLEVFSRSYQKQQRLRTYLHCREGFIDILAFDGRTLTILNSFPVSSVNDAVYYTIALSKSIGIDVNTMPFYVCGDKAMAEDLRRSMQQFAATVRSVNILDTLPSAYTLVKHQLPHSIAAHLTCV